MIINVIEKLIEKKPTFLARTHTSIVCKIKGKLTNCKNRGDGVFIRALGGFTHAYNTINMEYIVKPRHEEFCSERGY